MENKILEAEVIAYKNASKFKIKLMILVYKTLSYLNGYNFYFLISLTSMLIPTVFFYFSVNRLLLTMLAHYILFCKLLKEPIDKFFNTEKENREITEIIKILKGYLNKKTPYKNGVLKK